LEMSLEIRKVGAELLPLYAEIPKSFRVEHVIRVEPVENGLGGLGFTLEKVRPYTKWDEQDEEDRPKGWPMKYKVEDWGVFMAFRGSTPVGGIAIGADAPGGLRSPFEPGDTAVVWDIRVRPEERRHGVASALFRRGAEWAREEGHRRLKLEVTSANFPMCRFCVKTGCELAAVHRLGYETTKSPDEAMLIWYYELRPTEADPT